MSPVDTNGRNHPDKEFDLSDRLECSKGSDWYVGSPVNQSSEPVNQSVMHKKNSPMK